MRDALPPLRGPGLETATLSFQVVSGNEAAWAFAMQAGAYEQLVRCMDAYPNDPDVQSLCCDALACVGNAREDSSRQTWAAHPDKAERTGAIRAMVAALHAHSAHRNALISAGATLASIFHAAHRTSQQRPWPLHEMAARRRRWQGPFRWHCASRRLMTRTCLKYFWTR